MRSSKSEGEVNQKDEFEQSEGLCWLTVGAHVLGLHVVSAMKSKSGKRELVTLLL
jgi:hypothetical protein